MRCRCPQSVVAYSHDTVTRRRPAEDWCTRNPRAAQRWIHRTKPARQSPARRTCRAPRYGAEGTWHHPSGSRGTQPQPGLSRRMVTLPRDPRNARKCRNDARSVVPKVGRSEPSQIASCHEPGARVIGRQSSDKHSFQSAAVTWPCRSPDEMRRHEACFRFYSRPNCDRLDGVDLQHPASEEVGPYCLLDSPGRLNGLIPGSAADPARRGPTSRRRALRRVTFRTYNIRICRFAFRPKLSAITGRGHGAGIPGVCRWFASTTGTAGPLRLRRRGHTNVRLCR
jgi:hypothetical protein